MATSSSSTSAVANPTYKSYKFFINHRGVEVKKTFARSLYLRLREKGLTAFVDDEEMQVGYEISSQLEHVIRTASVHVAILSPRYAESYWCLNELVMMLQSNAPVIPVFYRVRPADVRWVRGCYGEALESLEKKGRYDTNTVKEWRNALHQVANNSGLELETCNGEELELELLDKLVKRLSEMVKEPDLHVADYPTGLDLKLKDFEDRVLLQKEESGKPQILGIVGLGGVGKTTLAKFFFNRKISDYSKSCFLADVRDHASKGSLHLLQGQLLTTLNERDEQVNNVHEGKKKLGEPLKRFDTLIVFDDVDNVDQVNAFLPVQTDNLNSRSLILITSRDRGVLRNSRVEDSSIYKLSGLNKEHSQELFCSYAFSQADPLPAFQHLVDKFLGCCHGLPLSLKIVGALLHNKEISQWEDELEDLKEILPSDIQKTLFRSYCSLDKQEKEIFLDIACFFIGENRDSAISIWDGSDWRGKRGFLNLQDKSLVEVDDWNCIRMHDHVRDLGREEAATSSPHRLWQTKRVIDYLSQRSFEIAVRGIRLVEGEFDGDEQDQNDLCEITEAENDGLNHILWRLQILHIEGSLMLERILRRVKLRRVKLPNLLWLSWKGCPYSSLPSLVTMKKLRVLRVDESELKTLLDNECESSAPLQLPASLEELHISQCARLKSIPVPAQGTKLRSLDVSDCSHLEELPTMETFLCLEELSAVRCNSLKSIRGLAQANKLRYLNVCCCFQLEELPSMETFLCLEELRARYCHSLKSIRGLAQAPKLRYLDVSRCSKLEELPSMETFLCLEKLLAEECAGLKSIRGSAQATKLRFLDVSYCSHLEELPTMETFLCLEELRAQCCNSLKSIRGSAQATKLRSLDVSECSHLEELPTMETFLCLEKLVAKECVSLKSIRGSAQATKLRFLDVSSCSHLEKLPTMETLLCLEELVAVKCVSLKSIRGSVQETKLRSLDVSNCSELEELPSLETMVSLQWLRAKGCMKLKSIHGLAQATKLILLDVYGCSELEELPDIERLVSLEELWADGCKKLKTIQGLGLPTNLRVINVSACSELEELPSMEKLVSLEILSVAGCWKLKSIRGSAQATKLRCLDVSNCSELEELPSLETMVSLQELWADECMKLKSIHGLAQATKLIRLNVSGCSELEELPGIERLVSLKKLWAARCKKLKTIQGLGQTTNLRFLDVYGCSELEELPSMEKLVSLKWFFADGCVKLRRIRGLEHARNLRQFTVSECLELEEVEGIEDFAWGCRQDVSKCPKLQCPVWE